MKLNDLIPVVDAFQQYADWRPAPNTIKRYIRDGIDGRKLKASRIAGRYMTTKREVERFLLGDLANHGTTQA